MGRRRASDHPCLVVCPPGLEDLVADELVALGARPERTGRGSVSVGLTTRRLYAANLFLRCATRVLVRIDRFTARSFADLERNITAIDWSPWLPSDAVPRFRVTTRHSRLWHDGAVGERFAAHGDLSCHQCNEAEHGETSVQLLGTIVKAPAPSCFHNFHAGLCCDSIETAAIFGGDGGATDQW
mgnify:CR=1 FL=1